MKRSAVVLMVLACALPAMASITLTTGGSSDGMAYWDREAGMANTVYKYTGALDSATLNGVMEQSYPSYWRRTPVFEFNLSPLNGSTANLTSAVLNLYFTSAGNGTVPLKYFGAGDGVINYYEGAGTVVSSLNASQMSGWQQFDVTAQIIDAVSKGYSYAGFAVYPDNYGDRINVAASESGSLAPSITVVPEPATMGLLAMGAMALVRRKK